MSHDDTLKIFTLTQIVEQAIFTNANISNTLHIFNLHVDAIMERGPEVTEEDVLEAIDHIPTIKKSRIAYITSRDDEYVDLGI